MEYNRIYANSAGGTNSHPFLYKFFIILIKIIILYTNKVNINDQSRLSKKQKKKISRFLHSPYFVELMQVVISLPHKHYEYLVSAPIYSPLLPEELEYTNFVNPFLQSLRILPILIISFLFIELAIHQYAVQPLLIPKFFASDLFEPYRIKLIQAIFNVILQWETQVIRVQKNSPVCKSYFLLFSPLFGRCQPQQKNTALQLLR